MDDMEKRKVSCLCQESISVFTTVQLADVPTELSQLFFHTFSNSLFT
jgi:hypothetical protein